MSNLTESDSYKTIAAPSTGACKERGSKFLSFAYPVSNEEDIKTHLAGLRKEYFDARHHCFAYRLGPLGSVWRANDDGEPSSSAGKPIYGQLLSYELSDILVVVVRYFGGVKLGVSGLIQAYRQATIDALQQSKILLKYDTLPLNIAFEYPQMNSVMKLLKEYPVNITDQQCNQICLFSLTVRRSQVPMLSQKLLKIDSVIILNS